MQVRPVRALDAEDAHEGVSSYPASVAERGPMHGLSGAAEGADAVRYTCDVCNGYCTSAAQETPEGRILFYTCAVHGIRQIGIYRVSGL